MPQLKIDRRTFLGVTAGWTILGGCRAADETAVGAPAETTSGKVRGLVVDGVNVFKGIPYGTAERFMPSVRPVAWTGEREAVAWGPEAPQGPHTEIPEVASTIPQTVVGEDCLVLNVWTNSLTGNRPVMVWLHGGGFSSGNGGYTMYDGANLARKRDVVAVTLNHRVNAFGYLYLAEPGGEKYADSGNLGMRDIVLALEWVRDNIANFGGDPNNVTIYGQSGGGSKVSTLLSMPAAKGLFHRAIIQSGGLLRAQSLESAAANAKNYMARLGVGSVDQMAAMPMEQLIAAAIAPPGEGVPPIAFSPVLDGKTLLEGPFDPSAPSLSPDVPLLIGTTEYEVTFFPNTNFDPMDDAALSASVKQALRLTSDADVNRVIAAYREGRPGLENLDYSLILASDNFRNNCMTIGERKAAQTAPVYMYYFTWQSPVREGRLKSFHTVEIPFHQENVDQAKGMTGEGEDRYALQDRMSLGWTNFARTGNPNHGDLPEWPAFDTTRRATMILSNEPAVVDDPHGEERRLVASLRQA